MSENVNESSSPHQTLVANSPSADQSAALHAHNEARKSRDLKPLRWDQNLSDAATEWARHLAREAKLYHSHTSGQGENLFWISSSSTPYHAAAQAWIEERKNYHGETVAEGNFASYGHYTQCMWHSTTNVGMGVAKDSKGNVYVVGRYSPPGNWTGQKPY